MIDYEKSNSNSYWKKNEYEIKLDVENDATEDEIKDVIEEAYMDDDHNMDIVNNSYDIKIRKL